MTATQHQKTELSHIATITDLNAEILKVKSRVTMQQEVLKLKLKQLPKEILKIGALTVIPGFLAARLSKRTFGVATGLLGWLFKKKEDDKSEAKKAVMKSAKQAGLYTGLTFLFNQMKKKFF
jgi:hypothetical protein